MSKQLDCNEIPKHFETIQSPPESRRYLEDIGELNGMCAHGFYSAGHEVANVCFLKEKFDIEVINNRDAYLHIILKEKGL